MAQQILGVAVGGGKKWFIWAKNGLYVFID
jgi:hypothetical protein